MSNMRAFTMPKWGIEMSEGTISEWNVKEGDAVVKGQVVAQIETDKIVNEVQIEYDTHFVRLVANVGEPYPVGALLAVTASEAVSAADIDAFIRDFVPAGAAGEAAHDASRNTVASAAAAAATPAVSPAPAQAPPIPQGVALSPAARERAVQLAVDVAKLSGSGRRGRITLQDVEQAAKPMRAVVGGASVSIMPADERRPAAYASPYASRLAAEHSIDLAKLTGTGPRGRISRQDVAAAAGVSAAHPRRGPAVEVIRMTPTRKAIARQLTLSKSTIPHFYLRAQANMDALLALRAEAKRATGAAPSVNDYLIRAVALALTASPDVNVQVHAEEIHRFRDADISVAVAADKGLITPVIRAAQTKSLAAISSEMRALAERARAGKLRVDEIEGGSFTVSNLGMFGIDQFDAIINPPQGAILAVGATKLRPIERGGGLSVGQVVNLSLSCDHRAIDGAVGAGFLQTLTELLEHPQRL